MADAGINNHSNDRLAGLEHSNVTSHGRSYSILVRFLKLVLPLLAIGLVLLLLLWPQITAVPVQPLDEQDVRALQDSARENRLLNPVFSAQDEKGRPVNITAAEAIQYKENDHIITLSAPTATIRDQDDPESQSSLSAKNGVYNRLSKTIILRQDIVIKGDNDMVLETDELVADLGSGNAQSKDTATLKTNQGVVTGQKIIIERNGAKTIFEGPAKAVMNE